ncbi:hypothetical protein GCM10022260_26540 [Gaetbulibacter aestuarii]
MRRYIKNGMAKNEIVAKSKRNPKPKVAIRLMTWVSTSEKFQTKKLMRTRNETIKKSPINALKSANRDGKILDIGLQLEINLGKNKSKF